MVIFINNYSKRNRPVGACVKVHIDILNNLRNVNCDDGLLIGNREMLSVGVVLNVKCWKIGVGVNRVTPITSHSYVGSIL